MRRQELDCLEVVFTAGRWCVYQPQCSDLINLFSVKKKKVFHGRNEDVLKGYSMFKLKIHLDEIDESVVEDLYGNKIAAKRVYLHVNYADSEENVRYE